MECTTSTILLASLFYFAMVALLVYILHNNDCLQIQNSQNSENIQKKS